MFPRFKHYHIAEVISRMLTLVANDDDRTAAGRRQHCMQSIRDITGHWPTTEEIDAFMKATAPLLPMID